MQIMHDKKGFTLVEVILSLAILGILCIAFLPAFTSGFKGIFRAGQNNRELFVAQKEMENIIDVDSIVTNGQLDIEFSGTTTISLDGQNVSNGSLRLFIPQR